MTKLYWFGSLFFISACLFAWYLSPLKDQHFDLDSYGYERIALHFAQEGLPTDPALNEIPVQIIGYPLVIGLVYKIFGIHWQFLIILQMLLGLATCFLIARAADSLWGESAGAIAFGLSAINSGLIVYPNLFLTETLFTFLLALWFERLVRYLSTHELNSLICSCAALGFSLAVKPASLFFIPIFLGFLIIKLGPSFFKTIKNGLMICALIVPGLSVMTFNYVQYNAFQLAPTLNENIYFYLLARIKVQDLSISIDQAYRSIEETFGNYERTDSRRWLRAKEEFWRYCTENPLLVAQLWICNMIKTIGGLFVTQLKVLLKPELRGTALSFLSQGHASSIIAKINSYIANGAYYPFILFVGWAEFILLWVRYMTILIAMRFLIIRKEFWLNALFLIYCTYFIVITGHDGCARYRMALEPLLIIFSALGILVLCRQIVGLKKFFRPLFLMNG